MAMKPYSQVSHVKYTIECVLIYKIWKKHSAITQAIAQCCPIMPYPMSIQRFRRQHNMQIRQAAQVITLSPLTRNHLAEICHHFKTVLARPYTAQPKCYMMQTHNAMCTICNSESLLIALHRSMPTVPHALVVLASRVLARVSVD